VTGYFEDLVPQAPKPDPFTGGGLFEDLVPAPQQQNAVPIDEAEDLPPPELVPVPLRSRRPLVGAELAQAEADIRADRGVLPPIKPDIPIPPPIELTPQAAARAGQVGYQPNAALRALGDFGTDVKQRAMAVADFLKQTNQDLGTLGVGALSALGKTTVGSGISALLAGQAALTPESPPDLGATIAEGVGKTVDALPKLPGEKEAGGIGELLTGAPEAEALTQAALGSDNQWVRDHAKEIGDTAIVAANAAPMAPGGVAAIKAVRKPPLRETVKENLPPEEQRTGMGHAFDEALKRQKTETDTGKTTVVEEPPIPADPVNAPPAAPPATPASPAAEPQAAGGAPEIKQSIGSTKGGQSSKPRVQVQAASQEAQPDMAVGQVWTSRDGKRAYEIVSEQPNGTFEVKQGGKKFVIHPDAERANGWKLVKELPDQAETSQAVATPTETPTKGAVPNIQARRVDNPQAPVLPAANEPVNLEVVPKEIHNAPEARQQPSRQVEQHRGVNVQREAAEAGRSDLSQQRPPAPEPAQAKEAAIEARSPINSARDDRGVVEPPVVSARKEDISASRERMGLDGLPPKTRPDTQTKSDAEALRGNEAETSLDIISKRRPSTDHEKVALTQRLAEIENEHKRLGEEIEATDDAAEKQSKQIERDRLQQEHDLHSQAQDIGTTESGRALRATQFQTDADLSSELQVVQRARKAKGSELTPEEKAPLESAARQLDKLNKAVEKAEKTPRANRVNREIKKAKASKEIATQEEFDALVAKAKELKNVTKCEIA